MTFVAVTKCHFPYNLLQNFVIDLLIGLLMQGFVYLIFSHGNPTQLVRLAKAIRRLSPESAIVFHHDASSLPLHRADFNQISNVYFIPNPIIVRWGDISFVDAFVLSSKWILENLDTEWLITISGMDYPIQPLAQFESRVVFFRFRRLI